MNTLLLVVLIINCLILGALSIPLILLAYSMYMDMVAMNKRSQSKIYYCNNCDKELRGDDYDDCYDDRECAKEYEEPTSVKCTRVFI